jgi:hypothetical protein
MREPQEPGVRDSDTEQVDTDFDLAEQHAVKEDLLTDPDWTEAEVDGENPEDVDEFTDGLDDTFYEGQSDEFGDEEAEEEDSQEDYYDDEDSCSEDEDPLCPDCHNVLVWSDYSGTTYAKGWLCNNVETCGSQKATMGEWRWFCQDCCNDFCEKCKPREDDEDIADPLTGDDDIYGIAELTEGDEGDTTQVEDDLEDIYSEGDNDLDVGGDGEESARRKQKVTFAIASSTSPAASLENDWVQISSKPAQTKDLPQPGPARSAAQPSSLPQLWAAIVAGGPKQGGPSAGQSGLSQSTLTQAQLVWEPGGEPCPQTDSSPLRRSGSYSADPKATSGASTPPRQAVTSPTRSHGISPTRNRSPGYVPSVPVDLRCQVLAKPADHCPHGHTLQPHINSVKASHNTCNRCNRQGIASPELIYRCFECDFDVCVACYKPSICSPAAQVKNSPISPIRRASSPTHLQPAQLGSLHMSAGGLSSSSNHVVTSAPASGTSTRSMLTAVVPPSTASGANPNEAPALTPTRSTAMRVLQNVQKAGTGPKVPVPLKQITPDDVARTLPFTSDKTGVQLRGAIGIPSDTSVAQSPAAMSRNPYSHLVSSATMPSRISWPAPK